MKLEYLYYRTRHYINGFILFLGGLEDGSRVKRVRADSAGVVRDPAQALDAPEPDTPADVPPSFLSPSVKEYLELGMAIPGK